MTPWNNAKHFKPIRLPILVLTGFIIMVCEISCMNIGMPRNAIKTNLILCENNNLFSPDVNGPNKIGYPLSTIKKFRQRTILRQQGKSIGDYHNEKVKNERTKLRNLGPAQKLKKTKRNNNKVKTSHSNNTQTWRIFGVEVDPDVLGPDIAIDSSRRHSQRGNSQIDYTPAERSYLSSGVLDSLCGRLKLRKQSCESTASINPTTVVKMPRELIDAKVVRRSLDARKNRGRRRQKTAFVEKQQSSINPLSPKYNYVIDIRISESTARKLKMTHQPGRSEKLGDSPIATSESSITGSNQQNNDKNLELEVSYSDANHTKVHTNKKKRVIIVGAGPAGLFCALVLAQSNSNVDITVLERGKPVNTRGSSIGALIRRGIMDPESNYVFGEGGAGTWSDGKLTTRIGRNSDDVRFVLKSFVKYGAPEKILIDGAPHLGTDNLVRILSNMRKDLQERGADIRFGAKVTKILKKDGAVEGVEVDYNDKSFAAETLYGDTVVLATGHSARDVYEELAHSGVLLEAKGFASGFRVEHPQSLINMIQYGQEWSPSVVTGRGLTDKLNLSRNPGPSHTGRLPVASYRLATDKAFDGESYRGAYSFCMCPGGQIVPASTDPNELCVNGMSFSSRNTVFANSALVVTVAPDDVCLKPYLADHGVLAGIAFQRDMEKRAALLGGGNLVAPVQSLVDFVEGRVSTTTPPSSYRLGVRSGVPCHEIYPDQMVRALRNAVTTQFDKNMPGFLSEEGILHAVETRTSSPVRVVRAEGTLQAIGIDRLYPTGEGAGFAGGIVSAAVDGMCVAEAVMEDLVGTTNRKKRKSIGFEY